MALRVFGNLLNSSRIICIKRNYSAAICSANKIDDDPCKSHLNKGLVLGLYTNPDDVLDPGKLTPTGKHFLMSTTSALHFDIFQVKDIIAWFATAWSTSCVSLVLRQQKAKSVSSTIWNLRSVQWL